ncbi:MAG: 3-hydroxyacyl-CoA dehydrogenase family protein [Acutalibacteraceae bacterium]|nr:3-hydroxyacyl-CoA dehydrogenase family protein [Acutalibacteraceae bacterium]
MKKIKTVTVIGATGTMGANVSGIFASFGNAKVYCVGRDIEKVKKTIPKIVKSVRADSIRENLIPADFSMLKQCVSESNLVFESLVEDISVKKEIASEVNKYLPSDSISCTGSSGLSIEEIAECYSDEKRKLFFGVHMFNPPYNMTLCELISTDYADENVKSELKDYLKNQLFRTVVEVKNAPAFLGNRIGFQFINEALQYAEKYKDNGGIDYIDAILGPFTGRAMPPLLTADFVGLDVHKAIVDNIYSNTEDYARDTFLLPDFASDLIDSKQLGRKTGAGLYKTIYYDNGVKRHTVFDIRTGCYRDIKKYVFPFADSMKESISNGDYTSAFNQLITNNSIEAQICLSFIMKYIVYSLYSAQQIGYTLEAADDVMATGFNWCPPISLYCALSNVVDVPQLIKERFSDLWNAVDIISLTENIKTSKYDYRKYFKSGR